MGRKLIFIVAGLFLLWGVFRLMNRPVSTERAYGEIDASQDPIQSSSLSGEPFTIELKRGVLEVEPQAKYEISAKVVSKRRYRWGWNAKIAPYDLALAWGDILDPDKGKHIKFRQMNRWYTYRYKANSPLHKSYIATHSSNHHIIPANSNIRKAIKAIKKNSMVVLRGFLVHVRGTYKGRKVWWNTSLSRSDTGDGSCEVFYVKEVRIKTQLYR